NVASAGDPKITVTSTDDAVRVIFAGRSGDSVNLWKASLSSRTWQVQGRPERITFGTSDESTPALAADGRLAFAAMTSNTDIWGLPLGADQARVNGELARLTTDPAPDVYPTVSDDGHKLIFLSRRDAGVAIWLRDLVTGKETLLPVQDSLPP